MESLRQEIKEYVDNNTEEIAQEIRELAEEISKKMEQNKQELNEKMDRYIIVNEKDHKIFVAQIEKLQISNQYLESKIHI